MGMLDKRNILGISPAVVDVWVVTMDYRQTYNHLYQAEDYAPSHSAGKRFGDQYPLIMQRKPSTVMELGCGRGDFIRFVLRDSLATCHGIDVLNHNDHWDTIGDLYPNRVRFSGGVDITALDTDNYTDCEMVCSFDFLEHLDENDVRRVVAHYINYVKHGGCMVHAIYNGPDVRKVAGDYVDLHLTQRPDTWWVHLFESAASLAGRHCRVKIYPAFYISRYRFVLWADFDGS